MFRTCVYTADAGLHPNAPMEDNPFLYLWIIAAFVSTCYTFTWDIKMDWGLFDKNAGENRFLREEIVYASKVTPARTACSVRRSSTPQR